jgi:hypothetical protein
VTRWSSPQYALAESLAQVKMGERKRRAEQAWTCPLFVTGCCCPLFITPFVLYANNLITRYNQRNPIAVLQVVMQEHSSTS